MENFAITLVCIALLIIGALSLSMSALNAINSMSDALREQQVMSRDIIDTGITCENSTTIDSGATVTMYVHNDGKTALRNYGAWDVIVRYQDGSTDWIPYSTATPGWQTDGFFFSGKSGDLRAQYS
jgi:archaellum component FlaG (FlaF/FlaG flagellin family)